MSETLIIVAVVFATVIGILWILLPFAVFGLKDLVRELLLEQKRTNVMLELATRNARDRNASKDV